MNNKINHQDDNLDEIDPKLEATENMEQANDELKQSDELSLEQQLEQAKSEASKNWDMVLRTQAEMANLSKRSIKDIESAHKFAVEKFARELLNIADSLELGLKATTDKTTTVESIKVGMELTNQQLFSTFDNLNIEIIDAIGVKFNPELHEAMTMIVDSKVEPNTVLEVIQKGYTLNHRLLRPSKVIVSKHGS